MRSAQRISSPPSFDDNESLHPPSDPDEDFPPPEDEDFEDDPPPDEIDFEVPSPPAEDPDSFEEFPPESDEEDTSILPDDPEDVDGDFPPALKPASFILPVNAIGKVPIKQEEISLGSMKMGSKVEQLSMGLIVKEPPNLLGSRLSDVVNGAESVTNQATEPVYVSQQSASISPNAGTAQEIPPPDFRSTYLEKGFLEVKGRFDGDPFETLMVKIDRASKILSVAVETGDVVTFNLSQKAFVFEDVEDPTTFILDYQQNMIIFKFATAESLVNLMKLMPEEVFLAPELEEEKPKEDQETVVETKPKTPKKIPVSSSGPKIDHVKGTSVEDILENDYETTAERREKIDQMFQTRENPSSQQLQLPAPKRKKELIETYIRKPKYSVRRVTLICEWVNSLKIWPNKLTIITLHREVCNGLLLASLFRSLKPDTSYINLHEKAMVKKAAIQNLEQVLGHVWRAKSLNNSRIPTAEDIYSGNTSKTAILLNELFAVYVLRPLYKTALKVLRWYNHILKQYQRPLPAYIFDEGDLSGVWPHFQSGTALFCVLFHFFGANPIGPNADRVDPLQIAGDPSSISDYRSNLSYVFKLLGILKINVLWSAEDWISNPDTEFIMFQLFLIYENLKDKQCTLPPAHGDKPGLTSGPNGEALVIGLVFSDAPANMKFLPKTRKAVRLGHDNDSMPLLPVDQCFINPRFNAGGTLPSGMISRNAKIAQVSVEFKESRIHVDRNQWNARTTLNTTKDNFEGIHLEKLLRDQQKLSPVKMTAQKTSNPKPDTFLKSLELSRDKSERQESSRTHEDITKEINTLVKNLEEEMNHARTRIKEFEEELADKYQQLEDSANACTAQEYEIALSELERERNNLELEKRRLQDYFTRKFAFIRERKEAVKMLQQAAYLELSSGGRTNPELRSIKVEKASTKSKAKVASSTHGEKGWISLTSKGLDTHNFHLKHKQVVAMANFQAKITPKSLLERDKLTENTVHLSSSMKGFLPPTEESSISYIQKSQVREDYVSSTFDRFRKKLIECSKKFQESRNEKPRSTLHDLIHAERKTGQMELISIPIKSVGAESRRCAPNEFDPAVRSEELRMMRYEDERRRIYISETNLENSLNLSQQLFQNISAVPNRPEESEEPGFGDTHDDLDTAFTFLAKPRALQMNDRIPKEYLFALTNSIASSVAEEDIHFALEWNEVNHAPTQASSPAGFVLMEDILSVQISAFDPTLILISLEETVRALRNAKGRTNLTIRCTSNGEASNYLRSLNTVLHACRS